MIKASFHFSTSILILSMLSLTHCKVDDPLKGDFLHPPHLSHPGVYWYFMDGNLDREAMTKDLESMKEVGIGNLIYLEVGIGVPRGSVDFMSEEWQDLFVHAVRESERLGIEIALGFGPGWCGSGGPWMEPKEAMRHLVHSEVEINGPRKVDMQLPLPEQRSTTWHTLPDDYYEDVAVYAFPASAEKIIGDITEKALYERDPISSKPGVKPYLPAPDEFEEPGKDIVLEPGDILNISDHLEADGRLTWDAPSGEWTIVRMGVRVTGASTRPSPEPAIGLECDKLSRDAFASHLAGFTEKLLERAAPLKEGVGWTGMHMDSWESGAQNWTEELRDAFRGMHGYDPEPFYLAFTGRAVNSVEMTERFLWDLRRTCQKLLLENHAAHARDFAHKHGMQLTIEPYDMNPAGDLDLGYYADEIMAEFWSKRFGFNTAYAVYQATSISHITGRPVVGAEVFTSDWDEAWQEYPWSMKDQGDWALALGVNRFKYHTFAHKPLGDEHRPGMTMGRYGVHWDRGQTWWPMAGEYHAYISRCSHMMQQGQAVSDILYLVPEGAPMVFIPPEDALHGNGNIPDKKGYGFDACSPLKLMEKAEVIDGKIAFPGATSYEILVLPDFRTMTPELLEKITSLVEQGAKIIGAPPVKSPSLAGYPDCDEKVRSFAENLWGSLQVPAEETEKTFGLGTIYWGGDLSDAAEGSLYPDYKYIAGILDGLGVPEDFVSGNNSIRFGHRKTVDRDIYFIANRTDSRQVTECRFRAEGEPVLWLGASGETRKITDYSTEDGITTIPMEFFPYESFFITFMGKKGRAQGLGEGNFPSAESLQTLEGSWDVSFDPRWGGPERVAFDELSDWTEHEQRGIRYYSGIATYSKSFTVDETESEGKSYFIDLGIVHDMARVKLNGKDIGVVWCAPWRIDVSAALQEGENLLEIEVANRWVNRLLGDRQEPDAGVRTVQFKDGLMGGKEYTTGRYTFVPEQAMGAFDFTEPLPSGLLGPVTLMQQPR